MSLSSIRFAPQLTTQPAQSKGNHAKALLGPLFAGAADLMAQCSKPTYAQQVLKPENAGQRLFMMA